MICLADSFAINHPILAGLGLVVVLALCAWPFVRSLP